jgi:hypothetical protein
MERPIPPAVAVVVPVAWAPRLFTAILVVRAVSASPIPSPDRPHTMVVVVVAAVTTGKVLPLEVQEGMVAVVPALPRTGGRDQLASRILVVVAAVAATAAQEVPVVLV